MLLQSPSLEDLAIEAQDFYARAIRLLDRAEVPFLVGGAYALAHYTGITRHTKDFDLFLREGDCRRALDAFARAGYQAELTFPHWLGKAHDGADFIDLIFSSGNGVAKVDDDWFAHSVPATFLGERVRLCPVEEIIWSKSFVCERERFDGADINHLILARGAEINWERLLDRFGPHWRVLLAHLSLFGFAYPSDREAVPGWVMEELAARLAQEARTAPSRRVCQGTLLSRMQYLPDLADGFEDARLDREAGMTPAQVRHWTDAGLGEKKPGT